MTLLRRLGPLGVSAVRSRWGGGGWARWCCPSRRSGSWCPLRMIRGGRTACSTRGSSRRRTARCGLTGSEEGVEWPLPVLRPPSGLGGHGLARRPGRLRRRPGPAGPGRRRFLIRCRARAQSDGVMGDRRASHCSAPQASNRSTSVKPGFAARRIEATLAFWVASRRVHPGPTPSCGGQGLLAWGRRPWLAPAFPRLHRPLTTPTQAPPKSGGLRLVRPPTAG